MSFLINDRILFIVPLSCIYRYGGWGQRNVWKEMTLEFPLLCMLALIILTPLFFDTVQVTPAACNAVLSPHWIFIIFHV